MESPKGASFQRKGIPDAGVECYTTLPDGSEWGWQAKYFDALGDSQWSQLDKSVKTALDKHPSLVRYFVCIPLNRPDARTNGRKSAMDRWNKHIKKWNGWAEEALGKSVEFVWWGSSELLDQLSKTEHVGRVYFWFGERGFDNVWFRNRLDEALKAAGPRYTPEVHVDLPIARELDIFGRTNSAFDEIKSLAKGIREAHNQIDRSDRKDLDRAVSIDSLLQATQAVLDDFTEIKLLSAGELPFHDIAKKIAIAEPKTREVEKALSQYAREQEARHEENGSQRYQETPFRNLLHVLLTVATLPRHPFNADFLDKGLRRNSMLARDAWWSTYLHRAWKGQSSVDRLVDWASGISPEIALDDRVVLLCATTLAWMLTASNRFLRDRATKALVCLLTGRIKAVERLVDRFFDVDDPYVRERVYAVAYGVVMRSNDRAEVGAVAMRVYERVFAEGSPPAHILLRDYARGVIERARYLGSEIDVDEQLIRPPYTSTWPKIPNEEEIQPYLADWDRDVQDIGELDRTRNVIEASVMSLDFARYVIGTNSSYFSRSWLSVRLDEEPWCSPDARMEALLSKLDVSVRSAWEEYKEADYQRRKPRLILPKNGRNLSINTEDDPDTPDSEQTPGLLFKKFLSGLNLTQRREIDSILQLRHKKGGGYQPRLDLKMIQRYVLWRVFDMGWTVERFGEFDRFMSDGNYGREARKAERMGKKYQWIAYHEILACIADHYQYREQYGGNDGDRQYEGPWQASLRDIDPSNILSSTPSSKSWDGHTPSWWAPSYSAWDEDTNRDWIACEHDIPDVADLFIVSNPKDKTRWINVQGFFDWMQPSPANTESSYMNRRHLWFQCIGYFLRDQDVEAFMAWAKGVDFWGRWMPESPRNYRLFLGEYGWSPAFRYFNRLYGEDNWIKPNHDCPVSIRNAAFEYLQESGGFDCSIDEGYTLRLPTVEFANQLGLTWTGKGAGYVDRDGKVAAFDPTAYEDGSGALLLREDLVKRYLKNENFALCWAVLGGKEVPDGSFGMSHHGEQKMSGVYVYTCQGAPRGFLNRRR